MRKTLVAITAAAALATFSVSAVRADHHASAEMDTSSITSGSYASESTHALVGWTINHLGFNDYFGIFGDVTGTLELDVDAIENSTVDVTIPLASATVPSEGLKDHLYRAAAEGAAPDFFGPDPAPARFVSTAVHSTGDHSAHIMGDLTFNGVTKPVTIEAELAGSGINGMTQKETVGFHGTTTIMRSDFGMGWGIAYGLGDEVELNISIAFEKQ